MSEVSVKPQSRFVPSSKHLKGFAAFCTLLIILLFALYVRSNTFWLPHWQGDQSQYVTLAMKLAKQGARGYHLREVEIRLRDSVQEPDLKLVSPVLTPGQMGDLAKIYAMTGFKYYNMPYFYKAPLFPAMLALSHKIFTSYEHPFVVVRGNLREEVKHRKPSLYFFSQFWAVIVPLASSLLTILVVFMFTRKAINARIALIAAYLYALHPIAILTSNRILTEDMETLLLSLSLFGFFHFYGKQIKLGTWFTGVLCGYAVLTNQKALIALGAVWFYTVLVNDKRFSDLRNWPSIFLNKHFLLFTFGLFFVSYTWFKQVYDVYGNPLFEPTHRPEDLTGWLKMIHNRPAPVILYSVGIPFLCPPFLAAYFSLKKLFSELKSAVLRQTQSSLILFLWLWVFAFFVYYQITWGREQRYMLVAYPALVILAAIYLDHFRNWIDSFFVQKYYGTLVIAVLLIGSIFWSVPLAMESVYNERFLILRPF